MSLDFIYPQYLWLLILLPISIALWLVGRTKFEQRRDKLILVLRMIIMTVLILAIAGAQIRRKSELLTTVFVLDISESIPLDEQSRGETFIRTAIDKMPPGDRAAIVVFGKDALVERLATDTPWLPELGSIPITTHTDIAGAIQLGMALFPSEGARRIVLLSDGQENLRYAIQQAEIAAIQDIELLYVALGGPDQSTEVWVETLTATSQVRHNEIISLETDIYSSVNQSADLTIYIDNNLFETRKVELLDGINHFEATINPITNPEIFQPGFRRIRIEILPDQDTRLQNNQAGAFTVVHGLPSILIISASNHDEQTFISTLKDDDYLLTIISPSELPITLAELANYDAIVLADVAAASLPVGSHEILQQYVRDLGKGLLMIGGEDSFGAGGYLRTPLEETLPVNMDVQDKQLQSNLALVLAVDKSGSMGRCHCDDPDLNQSYTRSESGQPKVDIAKEAIMRASEAMSKEDFLGVVTFDSNATWTQPLAKLVDTVNLEQSIGGFQANGQTNLVSGVESAYLALKNVEARTKHIILLTDGWVHTGDMTQLARDMQAQGITLSVIAAGEGSAAYLEQLANAGGGRYYPATNILNVPDLFLKETVTSIGEYIIEEPFYPLPAVPGPALRGLPLDNLPPLYGYNGTSPKQTARLELITPRGDPLLASWQYGLGRAAAWTSDLEGRWAKDWLTWDDFSRFSTQLIGWLLPAPSVEGLDAQVSMEKDQLRIDLYAIDDFGYPLDFLQSEATIIDPGMETFKVDLEQVGPGAYQSFHPANQPGVYLVRIGANQNDQSLGQLTLGLAVPYSPEYTASGINFPILTELAKTTGGSELTEPVAAFIHNLPSLSNAKEIWGPLLLIAILLFPFDVAVRRLRVNRQDLQNIILWVRNQKFISRASSMTPESPLLLTLLDARERVRKRTPVRENSLTDTSSLESETLLTKTTSAESEVSSIHSDQRDRFSDSKSISSAEDQDTIARLRQDKGRAQKKQNRN